MPENENIIAIGDIHGCCRTAEALLTLLEPFPDHQLVFLGDYIDRGPCSKEVVSLLIELGKRRDCLFLRGNHEQLMLDAVDGGSLTTWLYNGGHTTLHSYGLKRGQFELNRSELQARGRAEADPQETEGPGGNQPGEPEGNQSGRSEEDQPGPSEKNQPGDPDRSRSLIPDDHMRFYRSTQLYYQTEKYLFVHGGAPPDQTIGQTMKDPEAARHDFLWGREHLYLPEIPWEKTVIFGHTPRPDPIHRTNMIGIDTGCVFADRGMGKLTAVVLPDEHFIFQRSLDG